jgi:hypothetical protein
MSSRSRFKNGEASFDRQWPRGTGNLPDISFTWDILIQLYLPKIMTTCHYHCSMGSVDKLRIQPVIHSCQMLERKNREHLCRFQLSPKLYFRVAPSVNLSMHIVVDGEAILILMETPSMKKLKRPALYTINIYHVVCVWSDDLRPHQNIEESHL